MSSIVLTPRAERDVNEIWDWLASESLTAADRFVARLERIFRLLSHSPEMGHYREALADKQFKFILVQSYLVVYRPDVKPVQVIRVLHASRDVAGLLELDSIP